MGIEILERYIPDCSCSSKAAPQVAEAAQCRTGMIARIQSNLSWLRMLVQFLQRNRKALSGDSADRHRRLQERPLCFASRAPQHADRKDLLTRHAGMRLY